MSPTCYQIVSLLFKNYLIAPKHEKSLKKKCYKHPPQCPQNSSRFFKEFNNFLTISEGLKVLHKAVSYFEGCRFE